MSSRFMLTAGMGWTEEIKKKFRMYYSGSWQKQDGKIGMSLIAVIGTSSQLVQMVTYLR